MYTVKFADIEQ